MGHTILCKYRAIFRGNVSGLYFKPWLYYEWLYYEKELKNIGRPDIYSKLWLYYDKELKKIGRPGIYKDGFVQVMQKVYQNDHDIIEMIGEQMVAKSKEIFSRKSSGKDFAKYRARTISNLGIFCFQENAKY